MKKLTKRDYKKALPAELYVNTKLKRTRKGELRGSVHVRVNKDDFDQMEVMLKQSGIERSNFVRYALRKYLDEVMEIVNETKEIPQ